MALYKCACLATCICLVTAIIGQRGRYLAIRCADLPVVVITKIAAARALAEASTAAIAILWVASIGGIALLTRFEKSSLCQMAASASLQILAIVFTHSNG
uniref:Secreted protein n=1 Tax=Panstrongylus lignarius TaxID=156445 RepID=A0A224Y1J8_9HEMI